MTKYDLIFYLSRKTSYSEKVLRKRLSAIDFDVNRILSTTETHDLGILTCQSLRLTNVVFLIGGLDSSGDANMSVILSRVLSSTGLGIKNAKRLKTDKTSGYIISYKKQIIIALPDNPKEIEKMINNEFLCYLMQKFGSN